MDKKKLVTTLKKYFDYYDGTFKPTFICECDQWNDMMKELGISKKDFMEE